MNHEYQRSTTGWEAATLEFDFLMIQQQAFGSSYILLEIDQDSLTLQRNLVYFFNKKGKRHS